jgi:membrane dipeptidase
MRTLLTAALLATSLAAAPVAAAAPTADARAARILSEVPLADGHNDWPYALRNFHGAKGALTADLTRPAGPAGQTSIPLIRKGQLGLQLWSVFVPTSLSPEEAVTQTFEQIAIAKTLPARHPETFTLVTTADQAEKAWKAGRVASFLALEGAHQIAEDIPTLRRAWAEGVRAMTLVHSRTNSLFDSATGEARHKGMAPGGAAMIAEMNRLGVLVDLSHVSPAVMHQVLDVTKSPVVFTHSSARALNDHPRNVPDDVLKRLKANGGIVMVTFVPAFISKELYAWQQAGEAETRRLGSVPDTDLRVIAWNKANPRPEATLAQVADHVDHIARVAGIDHVGIGGDFDGIPYGPVGLENVSTYPALFAELARRGWSDEDLRKLAGKNFLRVLRANEKVAARLN